MAKPSPSAEPSAKPSTSQGEAETSQSRGGLGRTLRDLTFFAVVFLAALGFYYKRVQTSTQVNHIAKKAKDLLEKDTPTDFFEAEKQLKSALALDSNNAYCLSALAEMNTLLWGDDGLTDRRAEAEEYIKRADALDPHFQERYAADTLGMLYSGQATQAVANAKALEVRGAKGAHLFDAIGRAQRQLGRLDDAKKSFTDAAKAGWRNPRFNADLGEVYFDQGDLLNAESYFEKAVEENTEHPRALIDRARVYIARGEKIKVAADDLASLLGPRKSEMTPTLLARAYAARAELKLLNQQGPEAIQDAQAAVQADPNFAIAHFVLGETLAASQTDKALTEFDRALTIDPYVSAFYFDAAKSLLNAKQGDKAVAMLQRYQKSLPKDEHYYLVYGDILEKKGDQEGALEQYDQALKINNFSAQASFAKGRILQAQKKLPEAQKAYEAALAAQENFPEVHQQMGYLLMEAKKPADAASEFEQALELFKNDQAPREKLASLRDDFANRLKKGAPRPLVAKFSDDAKTILR